MQAVEMPIGENTSRLVQAWEMINKCTRGTGVNQMLEVASELVADQKSGLSIYLREMEFGRPQASLSGCSPSCMLAQLLDRPNVAERQTEVLVSHKAQARLAGILEHVYETGRTPSQADLLGAVVTYVFDLKMVTASGDARLETRKGTERPVQRRIPGLN